MGSSGRGGWLGARAPSARSSKLDANRLTERLRARAVELLGEEEEVWDIVDLSELRKPYAKGMPDLIRVRKTDSGGGTVPGCCTLNMLEVGREGRRGVPHHRLFSSRAGDFESE